MRSNAHSSQSLNTCQRLIDLVQVTLERFHVLTIGPVSINKSRLIPNAQPIPLTGVLQ